MHHPSPPGPADAATGPPPPLTALVAALGGVLLASGCAQDPDPVAGEPRPTPTTSTAPVRTPESTTTTPAPPDATRDRRSTTPRPAPPFVESATWGDSDYGETLLVAPSVSGRQAWGADDAATAWREVLALVPEADTPGMWEQFDCHWTWARLLEPGKPTWNIEPWRPDVSPERMLAEGCNPGGPEV